MIIKFLTLAAIVVTVHFVFRAMRNRNIRECREAVQAFPAPGTPERVQGDSDRIARIIRDSESYCWNAWAVQIIGLFFVAVRILLG